MVEILSIKMVMKRGWFMTLGESHIQPKLNTVTVFLGGIAWFYLTSIGLSWFSVE